jgi:tetratricopeptide (TPR) repeat protein
MYLSPDRYSYNSSRKARKRRRRLFAATTVVLVLAVSVLLLVRFARVPVFERKPQADLSELWNQGLYTEVVLAASERLESSPMDWEALVFTGFSKYYLAYYEKALEDRIPLLDQSIESLRKARLHSKSLLQPQIDYVLGLAYYAKGSFYYDLTVVHLERSLEAGHVGHNTFEYLGLAYGGLGQPEKELENLEKAAEAGASDLLLLSIGKAMLKLSRPRDAEEQLLRALNKTEDPNIEKEARFRLGDIYGDRGDVLKAEAEYRAIIDFDPNSAEAHFQLGELYGEMGDNVRARAEWRKTLVIDPTHYGARRRYYR